MPKYAQTLQLIKVNGVPIIDDTASDEVNFFMPIPKPHETDSTEIETDTPDDPKPTNAKPRRVKQNPAANPPPAKRGRKPLNLTQEEKDIRGVFKKEYYKHYYKNNPEKYKYDKYDSSNSCVYKLTTTKSDKVYYGSTMLPLNLRLKRHLSCIKNPKNATYIEMAAISTNWTIEPVVKVQLESKEMLNFLETVYISHYKENAINKNKKYSPEVIKSVCSLFPNCYLPQELQEPNKQVVSGIDGKLCI